MSDKKIVECTTCQHDFNEHAVFTDQFINRLDPETYQTKRFRTAICREKDCKCATTRVYEIARLV